MKKFSKYNTTLRISPQYEICYNAVSDKFVLLTSPAYDEMCGGTIENFGDNEVSCQITLPTTYWP